MPAKLLYRDAQGRDGAVDLRAEAVYIGRAVECAVRTDDAMVSRRHSLVSYIDGRYWIEDLGSSNGTHVNDVRVQRQALTHNDVVRCGSLWLRYIEEAPSATVASPSPPPPAAFPAPPMAAAPPHASPGGGMPFMAPGGGGPLAPSPFGPPPNANMLPAMSPGSPMQMPAMPPMSPSPPSPAMMAAAFSPPPPPQPPPQAHGTPFAPTPFVPSMPTPPPQAMAGTPSRTVSLKARPNEAVGKAQPQDFSEPTNAGAAQSEDVMLLQHELHSARQSIAELHAARDAAVAENRRLREELGRRVQTLSAELERLQGELAKLAQELGAKS